MVRAWLLGMALLLGACTSIQGSLNGELSVAVGGLPEGVEADVTVQPKGIKLSASKVLELPEGSYEVTANPVTGSGGEKYLPTVEGSPAEVKYGKRAQVRVRYAVDVSTLPGTFILVVDGLPEGAEGSIRVSGEGFDGRVTKTTRLTLRPGVYTLRAEAVTYAGERYLPNPTSDFVNLAPGSTVSKTITYAKEIRTGELLVNISGLPSGTDARVRVKDGSGTTVSSLTTSRLLTLPPGTYFVEADPVGTYVPSVSGSPALLNPGSRAEVQVAYQNRPASLTLSLDPTTLTVPQGGTGTVKATLTPQNVSGNVALSLVGAPSGVTLTPDSVAVNGPTQVVLALKVETGVAPGSYTLTVKAEGGGATATASLVLTVSQPDFTFSLSPTSMTLTQGASTTLVASISPQNGFTGSISFTLVGAPQGFSLTGGPVTPSGPTDVPLTLSVANTVAPGTYTLVVKASGGGVERTQGITVNVTSPTGELALAILFQGAPSGTDGHVVVSGQTGDITVTKSTVLNLPPGTYTITAFAVVVNGITYTPTPPGGTVQIQAGQTTSFTITYTPSSGQ
ncbi:hypothetical protein [Thermus albus]|uniref:COG1470 family protein n=1 Tax=Thermus albus TaxID=2908146 RepID=UPI001FA9ADB4|nr:hypothetical protein [Thermus albus]